MNIFCKHKWEVLSETTTKSKFETALDVYKASTATKVSIPHQMCCANRKFIQVVACSKCGKLSRYVENI